MMQTGWLESQTSDGFFLDELNGSEQNVWLEVIGELKEGNVEAIGSVLNHRLRHPPISVTNCVSTPLRGHPFGSGT